MTKTFAHTPSNLGAHIRLATKHNSVRRRAVTLIELLAAISICGVLIAILLPAVQFAREAARRTRCQSNLRQFGIAICNYVDSEICYPWGRVLSYDPRVIGSRPECQVGIVDKSYLVQLLPYLEAGPKHESFNHSLSVFANENDTVRRGGLAVFTCPSDFGGETFEVSSLAMNPFFSTTGSGWSVSATSYAGCFGTVPVAALPGRFANCIVPPRVYQQVDGVLGDIRPIRPAHVTDGLSKTMFIAERAFIVFKDQSSPRRDEGLYHGWWFSGNLGDSLFVAYESPNAFQRGRRGFADYCGAASMHGSGLHVLMGDGSAHWVSDSIDNWHFDDANGLPVGAALNGDTSFSTLPPRGVWQAMATRAGNDGGL